MKKYEKIILVCLVVLCFLSLVRFINSANYWLVDIFSHFPAQYAIAAMILSTICFWKRILYLAICAGLLFVLNMSVLVDSASTVQAAGHEHNSFKVYSANINKSINNVSELVERLSETDADILLLLEVTEENIHYIQPLIQSYTYRIINLNIGTEGTGTVLISKFPILNHQVTKYSEFGNMLVSAIIEIYNKKVMFHATHFPKPTSIQEFPVRTKQILSLAKRIREQSIPVIVAGDFNATPFSPTFKQLVKISGLRDSRTGFGWLPSWPTYFPLFWLPIDHILVSPEIQVHNRNTGSHIGSDHYPVVAELSIDR